MRISVRIRLALAAVAAAAFVTAPGLGAGAQGSEPTISVEEIHPSGPSVHYIVRMVTASGDPVDGATVTAVPTGPDGADGPSITLVPAGDGRYQGAMDMAESGEWTVTFTATNPDASLEYTQEIPVEDAGVIDENDDGNDGTGGRAVFVVITVVLIAVVGVAIWAFERRRRREAAEGDPFPPDPRR